jgi:methyltransferase (TIGR00027 family)
MSEIEHVSDTALWVATYRAMESERPDASFKDPLANLLIGERGRQIEKRMPFRRLMHWVMVVRTTAIDELILDALAQGVDTVLNLGAGLDTRPYRMSLPPDLRWIEADFPHMIELKNTKLVGEKPVCRLERVAIDLSDVVARRAFLDRVGKSAKGILFITEGVVAYLSDEEAASLARDLFAVPTGRFWIQDVYTGQVKHRMPSAWKKRLKAAPFKFNAPDWVAFFAPFGWKVHTRIGAVEQSGKLGRPLPFVFPWSLLMIFFSRRKRREMRNLWAYVLLEKN